eukprot:Gb_22510 [translate_table: standard]
MCEAELSNLLHHITNASVGFEKQAKQWPPASATANALVSLRASLRSILCSDRWPTIESYRRLQMIPTLLESSIDVDAWLLGAPSMLKRIDLHGNQLVGSIPNELGECSNTTFFSLDDNRLQGPIPPGISLILVRELGLSGNSLSGNIKPEFLSCGTDLIALQLQNNLFS